MDNFKKQFKQGDDYCDIRADYRSLISIGKSVLRKRRTCCCGPTVRRGSETCCFTPTFWLSLGICEWETGRLTPRTKEEALYCLSLYQETVEQRLAAGPNQQLSDMLQFFRETQEVLLSPSAGAQKESVSRYARKCPWREGSLLASRDFKSEDERFSILPEVCHPSCGRYLAGTSCTACSDGAL